MSASPPVNSPADGLPPRRRRLSALAIWAAMTMCVLDTSFINIALPPLGADLCVPPSTTVLVLTVFQTAIAMTLLTMSAIGERIGYRRTYLAGVGLFIVASILCAVSPSFEALLVGRLLQGLGAAPVMAVNGALVRFTYPAAMLGRGVSYNALVVALSVAAGPMLAAGILISGTWRLLFAINVPIGLLALALGIGALPQDQPSRRPLEWPSAVYSAAGFGGLMLAGAEIARTGSAWRAGALLAVAGVALFVLFRAARRQKHPLVPLDLLGISQLRLSYLASLLAFAAQTILLVALPFYVQSRFGFSAIETGLIITPWPLAVMAAAPVAGRLGDRLSPGRMGGAGLVMVAVGLVLIALAPAPQPHGIIVFGMSLGGLGFVLFQTPNNRLMLSVAPLERSGAAGGMLAAARTFGIASGAVAIALIFRFAPPDQNAPFFLSAILVLSAAWFSLKRT